MFKQLRMYHRVEITILIEDDEGQRTAHVL